VAFYYHVASMSLFSPLNISITLIFSPCYIFLQSFLSFVSSFSPLSLPLVSFHATLAAPACLYHNTALTLFKYSSFFPTRFPMVPLLSSSWSVFFLSHHPYFSFSVQPSLFCKPSSFTNMYLTHTWANSLQWVDKRCVEIPPGSVVLSRLILKRIWWDTVGPHY